METAKQSWRSSYRDARKLARFIGTFHGQLSTLPARERTFPQCRGFGITRLSGDTLGWIGDGLFAPSIKCQRARLACLRHQQPMLPA